MSRSKPSSIKKKSTNKSTVKKNKSLIASQVRIIGGRYKRQTVPFIDGEGLRPTPDRLREKLFNWLQFDLHDTNVLDLCAGSGVLGFETLSRGAQYVAFIELQPKQVTLIKQTAERLRVDADCFDVFTGDALQVIPKISHSFTYDLVFIDPPYDLDIWTSLINCLLTHHLISSNTLLYIEDRRPVNETLHDLDASYTIAKEAKVGQVCASLIQLE